MARNEPWDLWDFDQRSVCKLVGITFTIEETIEIGKEKNFIQEKTNMDYGQIHGHMVYLCTSRNNISEYVSSLLESRFRQYEDDLGKMKPQKICRLIETGKRYKDVPLPAMMWFALRNSKDDLERIEFRILTAIHLLEHDVLRSWDITRSVSYVDIENEKRVMKEKAQEFQKQNDEFERIDRKCQRLERRILEYQEDIMRLTNEKSELFKKNQEVTALLQEQSRVNGDLRSEIDLLGGRKKAREVLRTKMKLEGSSPEGVGIPEFETGTAPRCHINRTECNHSEQKSKEREVDQYVPDCEKCGFVRKIAFIGGIQSLKTNYQQISEENKCDLCFHNGICSRGIREIDTIIGGMDVVFCSLNINSHNATRLVKTACKNRKKPCYFMRSSSVSTFRKALNDYLDERFEIKCKLWTFVNWSEMEEKLVSEKG
jgi:hypothetical protein